MLRTERRGGLDVVVLMLARVGLLAVDLSAHGVVMSADSQRVEILAGLNRVPATTGRQTRDPIVMRSGGGFVGLVGFAGTEHVEGTATADWLRRFGAEWSNDDVGTFCSRLASRLTEVWQRDELESVLEMLVAGEVSGDVQFWFVRNSQGLRESDWMHEPPTQTFETKDDLDGYIKRDSATSETKDELLGRVTYSFRQGVLVPSARVFDGFSDILRAMYEGGVPGFAFARVRIEFLKRLCTAKYGIYDENIPTPIGGDVHVYGVGRDGQISQYSKGRNQIHVLRPGRT